MPAPIQIDIDTLCNTTGGTAALRLLALFGGAELDVPKAITPDHILARLNNLESAARLATAFGGGSIRIPEAADFTDLQRVRQVSRLVRAGVSPREIAMMLGIGTRQVTRYRAEAEALGVLPMVFDSAVKAV